jgi:enediyne biosynthesis protein E3
MVDLVTPVPPASSAVHASAEESKLRAIAGNLLGKVFAVSEATLKPPAINDDASSARLKQVVFTVTECCQITVLDPRFETLVPKLDAYDKELAGFAYEGAGVGLAALDTLIPTKRRTLALATGPGAPYIFGIYLGAGMGLARMRLNPEPFRKRLGDPLFGWAVLDGYGFHQGFFAHQRYVIQQRLPRHLHGYGLRVFDHGMGRSIWFSSGADVDRVAATIAGFAESRQADLWQGVGLACGYTGGVDRPTVDRLREVAGERRGHLAVGVAMSASIRHHVGNPADHNDFASEVLCGVPSEEAAAIVESLQQGLPTEPDVPAYALLRQRILRRFE